jgi:hypothetical protein
MIVGVLAILSLTSYVMVGPYSYIAEGSVLYALVALMNSISSLQPSAFPANDSEKTLRPVMPFCFQNFAAVTSIESHSMGKKDLPRKEKWCTFDTSFARINNG